MTRIKKQLLNGIENVGIVATFFIVVYGCLPQSLNASTRYLGARVQAAETALNVLTDIVDPAYEATRVGCDAAERAALILAEDQKIDVDELTSRIQENRQRCDKVISIYEQMITLQRNARELLRVSSDNEQALNQVEADLAQIRQLWREKPAEPAP